ncbi:MAG TPA: slipin family protein [Candidatus Melainabacteria bacterium]|nr:slipin family protein [Candidatus Melainabacteria bacterium]
MNDYIIIVKIALVLLAFLIVIRLMRFFKRQVIYEYQVGLLYKSGKFDRLLEPGSHWINPFFDTVQTVDTRATTTVIGAQEVISSDNIGLKLSISARYRVADAVKYTHEHASSYTELYSLIQIALRNAAASTGAEALIEKRKDLGAVLLAEVKDAAAALGIEVQSVDIKDIMYPAEIRKIYSEVVRAQKEGQAALERARGEQAALRSLANAARMLENNPALMNLRILQSLSNKAADGTSPNIVLGLSQGLFPLETSSSAHSVDKK